VNILCDGGGDDDGVRVGWCCFRRSRGERKFSVVISPTQAKTRGCAHRPFQHFTRKLNWDVTVSFECLLMIDYKMKN
jgi:hypothetical protein